ncbi:hypothetical protein IP88_15000 [alpha proteobacterium AAP81b]|nr:hypothetical protein IP88_15000 [alpha proteobacterium AAP81b]
MGDRISGIFATRREAEMAVERLVQEHDVPRGAILVAPAAAENSVGSEIGGSDAKRGPQAPAPEAGAALHGAIAVSLPAGDLDSERILAAFREFDARDVRIGRDA